jgi:flagellar hook protein FlgE
VNAAPPEELVLHGKLGAYHGPTRAFVVDSTPGADLTPGVIQATGRDLDLALQGSGWIAVQAADGSMRGRVMALTGVSFAVLDGTLIFASGSVGAKQKASATHAMDRASFSNAQAVVTTSQASLPTSRTTSGKRSSAGITDSANRN